ncbi:SWIM zinc finger family protein [Nocardiopsis sp. CNT312]|uniref:SWIM zinc finger family protein n=1 Tax=Nocardiopsis sp. CNT312 TaxID=1137268 RepID=UPI0004AEE715|nr:SWIM zinc finger family protein [Nocardiopsis sp. CNT312]
MGLQQPVCESWWARRLLEGAGDGDPGRLNRGRAYLRRGAVAEITVDAGRAAVSAEVHGSRVHPYYVSLVYQTVGDRLWDRILADLAASADTAADLLAGVLPERIEEVFARHGVALFPDSVDDLGLHCTCPDWGYPCKHAAALLFAFAALLDDDPLLLFTWMGRTEGEVLGALAGAGKGRRGELSVEVTPSADRVADFWEGAEPARLAPPRPFTPLDHWEGATPGVFSRLAPMYERLGRAGR